MAKVIWLASFEATICNYREEVEILNGPDVAKVKLRRIIKEGDALGETPNLGFFFKTDKERRDLYALPCLGGYLIYYPTKAHIFILFFIRDSDMPDSLKVR